jgi:6-phosphogluconate dehydrogenase (decarboxylating)
MNEMTREEFRKQLRHHDWYFDFSDDFRVWSAGNAARSRIQALAKTSAEFKADFDAASDYIWSGESFGKPQAEKPSWWDTV